MRKRIGIKRIRLQKLFAMHNVLQRRNCLEKVQVQLARKTLIVIVSATEIKSNSSFFNKDANTTLLNNMNATQLHFDSSDSEEGLNSKRKKRKEKTYASRKIYLKSKTERQVYSIPLHVVCSEFFFSSISTPCLFQLL